MLRDRAGQIAGLNCMLQILAVGADTAQIGIFAALSNVVCGLFLVVLAQPTPRLLAAMALPVLILCGGLAWAVWPDFSGMPGAVGDQGTRVAPDLVATEAARVVGFIALLIGACAVGARRDWVWAVAEWITVGGVICLITGLALRSIDPNTVWGMKKGILANRYTGTMLNANAMGAIHAAFAVLALGLLLAHLRGAAVGAPRYRWVRLQAYGAVALAQLGACSITGSRTAFIAAAASSALLAAFYRASVSKGQLALALGPCALVLFMADLAVADRFASLTDDWESRTALWDHFGHLARSAGPHGFGLGSFAEVNRAMLPSGPLSANIWYVNAAHNVVLQCIIEGGWVYALLLCLAAVITGVKVATALPHSYPARLLQLSLVCGCGVIVAVGLVDIALNVPAAATLAATLWGLAWGRSLQKRLVLEQQA